eukprot:124086_1
MSQVGMEHLIQFRILLDSLSHTEYCELFSDIFQHNRELFASLLFTHLIHSADSLTSDQSDGKSCINVHALNSKAIKIINARSSQPQIADDRVIMTDVSLDHLPDDVVAKISSNLCLDDCIQFEQTNRRIFIIMRSNPLALSSVTLNAEHFANYSSYVMDQKSRLSRHRFDAIQNVEIPSMDPDKIIDLSRWRHVQSLKLYDEGFYDHVYEYLAMDFESVKHLQVYSDGHSDAYLQQEVYAFLQKCVHLEYLSLINFGGFTGISELALCKLESMKHIKGLITSYQDLMIDLWQHQLKSLHMHDINEVPKLDSSKQYAFGNLKELCLGALYSEHRQAMTAICNSGCDQLERLHITFDSDCGAYLRLVDCQTALERLFPVQSLNCISIYMSKDNCAENVLEQILKVFIKLLSSGNKSRMKIRIDHRPGLPCDDKNIDQAIIKLIQTANTHVTKDWMFIFDYDEIGDVKRIQEFVQWTRKMSRKLDNRYLFTLNHKYCDNLQRDKYRSAPDMQLIISNYECNISGYKEKWIYDCGCAMH